MGKKEKFIGKFKINYEEMLILKCPSNRKVVKSEYNNENKIISALFYKNSCNKCRYLDICIKEDFDETFNKVEISCLDLDKYIEKKYDEIFTKLTMDSLQLNKSIENMNSKLTKKENTIDEFNEITKDFILSKEGIKYIGNSHEVIIPEYINSRVVDKIAENGFANKSIQKVTIPNTVKVIGRSAFNGCKNIKEIIIPNSVTNIETWAFGSCKSLKKISLSDNVIEIGSHAFDECCNLEEVNLPKEINYIGAYAFSETGIKKITLPRSIKYLANSLFYECRNLREVVLSDNIEVIGKFTFANCVSLRKVIIPNSIKKITASSFANCMSLQCIRIPDSLEELDVTAFTNCFRLQRIETNDINRRIVKYNEDNELLRSMGAKDEDLQYVTKYDTIYNILTSNINNSYTMLGGANNKSINAIPIKESDFEIEGKYEDILIKGVEFKRQGEYEEAKNMYIQAIKMDSKKPMAYYNLGKILYILGEFEASARAYKTSFELGVDPVNVLIHLGHALLDQKSKNNEFKGVVSIYERGINPYLIKKYINNIEEYSKLMEEQPSTDLLDEYENKCIVVAKGYLGIE